MTEKKTQVCLGLGSNIGDSRKNIEQAIQLLQEHPQIEIESISTLIETKAASNVPQPKYINGAKADSY